eukprot:scaffold287326_cov20-Prasinocladus_malaysianus.AAC.1
MAKSFGQCCSTKRGWQWERVLPYVALRGPPHQCTFSPSRYTVPRHICASIGKQARPCSDDTLFNETLHLTEILPVKALQGTWRRTSLLCKGIITSSSQGKSVNSSPVLCMQPLY